MYKFKYCFIIGSCIILTACASNQTSLDKEENNTTIEQESSESATDIDNPEQEEEKALQLVETSFGKTNEATGYTYSIGYTGILDMEGETYYEFRISWLNEESGNISYLSDAVVPEDLSTVACYEDGILSDFPEDSNGNLTISEEEDTGSQIAVLMGGTVYSGMQSLVTENYEDGGYYYVSMTEDGQTEIINSARPNSIEDSQSVEDYIIECAYDLGDDVVLEPQITQIDTYSEKFTFPVYIVTWNTGENEEQKSWETFFFMTDTYTYTYTFTSNVENADAAFWEEEFGNLYLE